MFMYSLSQCQFLQMRMATSRCGHDSISFFFFLLLYRHYSHLYHNGTIAPQNDSMDGLKSHLNMSVHPKWPPWHVRIMMSNNHQNGGSKSSSRRLSRHNMSQAPWALGSIFQNFFLFTRKSSFIFQILLFLLIFAYLGTFKKVCYKKRNVTKYHACISWFIK